jgi:hypothetical protein
MIGSIVKVWQTGATMVVRHCASDGRLHLRGKEVYGRNRRTALTARVVGAGDVTVIADPPTYIAGTQVRHDGTTYTVLQDWGDHVQLSVPEQRAYCRNGVTLKIPGGNTVTISKADLVLERMQNGQT